MNNFVLKRILSAVENGKKAALVLLTSTTGSTPGKEGVMMAVIEDGEVIGTIGGGKIEFEIIDKTRQALNDNRNFEFNYELVESADLGMVCGGSVKGAVHIFYPNKKLVLFGAGHISQKIAEAAKNLSFDVFVIDDREEFSSKYTNYENYLCCKPQEAVDNIAFDKNTFVVIVTRGHLMDYDALIAVMDKETAYTGMIGSKKKVAELKNNLIKDGYAQADIEKLYAPIGLDIADGTPEEIAFSVISEILLVKNNKKLQHMKERDKNEEN